MNDPISIWCNAGFGPEAMELLTRGLGPHRLLLSAERPATNLVAAGADPLLAEASVAFGQPDPRQVIDSPHVKWVHLTSAGYTRYDTDEFRQAMRARGARLTNSSQVYADPCAQHAMAMVMALARQLPQALDNQSGKRGWPGNALRAGSHLLTGQSMLIYGYGSIAKRLVQLLAPFNMKLTGVRRKPVGDEGIAMVSAEQADVLLPQTDHVMNILPASPATDEFFNAARLARIAPTALFYNIGRGNTVNQNALLEALQQQRIAGAYLDVTTPEPLPPDHALWTLTNCWITPHTAGGHASESIQLVRHFRQNLDLYLAGKPLVDQVVGG
jgi:phosphoglycerate dehydrogenase-like enzyme